MLEDSDEALAMLGKLSVAKSILDSPSLYDPEPNRLILGRRPDHIMVLCFFFIVYTYFNINIFF